MMIGMKITTEIMISTRETWWGWRSEEVDSRGEETSRKKNDL